jgi:hypothetical protein
MKLYRYMSGAELDTYKSGGYVVGRCRRNRDHGAYERVCFLGSVTAFTSYFQNHTENSQFMPERCYEFLSGIVSDEFLVEFEVTEPYFVIEGSGVYADPINGAWGATITITEYWMDRYSQKELRLLSVRTVEEVESFIHGLYQVQV